MKDEKKKRGGPRPGSGRKPRSEKLSNYSKAVKMLDDNIIEVLSVLIKTLRAKSVKDRLRASEILIKRMLPEKVDLSGSSNVTFKHLYKNEVFNDPYSE